VEPCTDVDEKRSSRNPAAVCGRASAAGGRSAPVGDFRADDAVIRPSSAGGRAPERRGRRARRPAAGDARHPHRGSDIVAAGSQPLARQAGDTRSVGLVDDQIRRLLAGTAHQTFGLSSLPSRATVPGGAGAWQFAVVTGFTSSETDKDLTGHCRGRRWACRTAATSGCSSSAN
jgi:hypothetical protein